MLAKLNDMHMQDHPGSSELAARLSSYELAFRMQGCAPAAVEIDKESEATKKLYGLDDKTTEPFGRQCIMARRLVERGVRFVQLYHRGWDHHNALPENIPSQCRDIDQAQSGLILDLKRRGLLDETIVVCAGEFGRTPQVNGSAGRDHWSRSMAVLLAGGGFPGGVAYGGMAIYDVMQHVRCEVSTICVGMGMSAAAMILCGGAPGMRLALPSAKIMIHQGSAGTRGAPRDMEIHLKEVMATTRRMAEIIAHHTGRAVAQVRPMFRR